MAGEKKGWNVFQFMKPEESMAGEDSEQAGTCYKFARTHFRIRTKKSNENSGIQKVWNWKNCGILQNSKRISQPSLHLCCRTFVNCCFLSLLSALLFPLRHRPYLLVLCSIRRVSSAAVVLHLILPLLLVCHCACCALVDCCLLLVAALLLLLPLHHHSCCVSVVVMLFAGCRIMYKNKHAGRVIFQIFFLNPATR